MRCAPKQVTERCVVGNSPLICTKTQRTSRVKQALPVRINARLTLKCHCLCKESPNCLKIPLHKIDFPFDLRSLEPLPASHQLQLLHI